MKVRWASTLPLLLTTLLAFASQARGQEPPLGPTGPFPGPMPGAPMGMPMGPPMGGQMPYGPPPGGQMPYGPPPGAMPGPGGMPGMMYPPPSPAYAPGEQFISPPGGMPMDPAMAGYGPDGSCPDGSCYGGAHGHRWWHHGLLGEFLACVGPYPDGGCAAPRWYDFSIEYMSLKRDDTGRRVDFTSAGPLGPIVLSTDDLEFDRSHSFRFSAMLQAGAGSNFEFTYYGLHFFDDGAFVADPVNNDLFSVVSDFGAINFPLGFSDTDQSNLQTIAYSSQFDNFEINFRQRWSSPNCRYQGSWLAGVRYFKLDEKFTYETFSVLNNGFASFGTDVNNSLTGGQLGGDVWICIVPGLKIGAEGKAGVYGNHANVTNQIVAASQVTGPFDEQVIANDVAFVGDANLQAIYRLSQQWTLKVGYTFLYVDGVALASENFNPTPPAIFNPPPGVTRVATANDNGSLFYHGFTVGTEFLW